MRIAEPWQVAKGYWRRFNIFYPAVPFAPPSAPQSPYSTRGLSSNPVEPTLHPARTARRLANSSYLSLSVKLKSYNILPINYGTVSARGI